MTAYDKIDHTYNELERNRYNDGAFKTIATIKL